MVKRAATSRLLLALALALVLVAQSVVGAFALGTAASGPQFDAFGNPLCLNGPNHDGESGGPDHSKMPNCCTFACSMFWPGLPAPADVAYQLIGFRIQANGVFANRKAIFRFEPDYQPGNPRAPPLTT